MALPNTNITPGRPPLLWSDVDEAFKQVNENFDSIAATLAMAGLDPVNFETLDTNLSPTISQSYSLGSPTNKWKSVFTGAYSETPGSELNGIWAGNAQIKGIGYSIELPAGSTVAGNLIIDPEKRFFNSVQVDNDLRIEATGDGISKPYGDTLNVLSGNGISLSVDSSAESITIDNTGILTVTAGTGILTSTVSGTATVTNDGVVSLGNTTTLPPSATGRTTGAGIIVSAAKGSGINITNTGLLEVQAGFGITVSTDSASGIATVSFNSGVAPQTAFTRFHITGDSPANDIQSDNTADTFNLTAGYGILLSNNITTDTLTIGLNNNIDIRGSVFADNSTLLVDGTAGRIPAEVVQGTFTGNVVGNITGTAGVATTVTLSATESTAATHYITFVDSTTGNENVRTDSSLTYNPSTNTLTTSNFVGTITGNIFTNLIDSADSSQIVVTPLMRFESDVVIENELTVGKINGYISTTELKALVAASTDFANFKARIAAL